MRIIALVFVINSAALPWIGCTKNDDESQRAEIERLEKLRLAGREMIYVKVCDRGNTKTHNQGVVDHSGLPRLGILTIDVDEKEAGTIEVDSAEYRRQLTKCVDAIIAEATYPPELAKGMLRAVRIIPDKTITEEMIGALCAELRKRGVTLIFRVSL
jgi:hypothetical protein